MFQETENIFFLTCILATGASVHFKLLGEHFRSYYSKVLQLHRLTASSTILTDPKQVY